MLELWLRAGMSMKVTESELEEFKKNPQEKFLEYVKEGKIFFNRETYFPAIDENEKYGMDEFDFHIVRQDETNGI